MSFIRDHCFKEVSAYTQSAKETLIPDGETWEIQLFVGSAAYLAETVVKLVWDFGGANAEVISSTHGDTTIPVVKTLVGNGAKKLAIVLCNDSGNAQILGGAFEGKKI